MEYDFSQLARPPQWPATEGGSVRAELRSLLVFGSCEIVSSFNGMGVILRLLARNKGTQREVFERDAT